MNTNMILAQIIHNLIYSVSNMQPKNIFSGSNLSDCEDLEELLSAPGLARRQHDINPLNIKNFPLRVTPPFLHKIRPGTPDDPLLGQILPQPEESSVAPHEKTDPVGDLDAIAAPGIIHKYPGRALLFVTNECSIHCRFCFRRNSSSKLTTALDNMDCTIKYLINNPEISEVILSGGDPLFISLSDFSSLLDRLSQIRHLRRIRVHTRIPVTLPDQLDSRWIRAMASSSRQLCIVTHTNHAQEIDSRTKNCFARLKRSNIILLSQTVLLRNINDNAETLKQLFETLFDAGVLPYYLHMLDPAVGTSHFSVDDESALTIWQKLQHSLPGYLVPRLVREQPGHFSKTILCK